MTRLGTWIGRGLLLLLAPLLVFGVLEVAGLILDVPIRADQERYRARHDMRLCRFGAGDVAARCVARPRNGSALRVAVFGGSTVQGFPTGAPPFATYLQRRFDRTRSAVEVQNFGFMCKDTIFVRSCVELAIQGEPDVIVIYAGHNDFSGFMKGNPRSQMVVERNPWLMDLDLALSSTRGYSLLFQVMGGLGGESTEKMWTRLPDETFESTKQTVFEEYRRNLVAILDMAEARDIPVVLVTLVSNLYDYPVGSKFYDHPVWAKPSGSEVEVWHRHFFQGVEDFRAERYEEALGEFLLARDSYMRGRAPSIANDLLRELAATRNRVFLVDFEEVLHREGLREGIGCNFFGGEFEGETWCDQFHPNARTHRMMAEAIHPVLVGALRDRATGAGPR